jgi:cysteine-rich repeat protein
MRKLAKFFVVLTLGLASCTSQDTGSRSSSSEQADGSDEGDGDGCTYTQGYWKNHADAWPVDSVELGSVSYSKAEALAIFATPVRGNGLIALAHQLIAAKLNVAAGADDSAIADAIAAADAAIGSLVVPPGGSGSMSTEAAAELVAALDAYNNGVSGPGHCGDQPPPPPPSCGDGTVNSDSEQCDDGNTSGGDGCSEACQVEEPPPVGHCGDEHVDAGEGCDDGNSTSGDGCSEACQVEVPPPPAGCCGDGTLDEGEECDDGNTIGHDGCSVTCQTETPGYCGDHGIDPGEGCDDGNTTSGDGCSEACQIEQVCDDNTDPGPVIL